MEGDPLLDVSVGDFLDRLASPASAPGGGSAAALAAAFAATFPASLVAMVGRRSGGFWQEAGGVAAQALAVQARSAPLALADAQAWELALQALAGGMERNERARFELEQRLARSIFGAKACSTLLLDEETNELVFEAVAGHGEESLLGLRFPAGTAIAGWVLATRTPLIVEDVLKDPRFASTVAADTGPCPRG